jgi:hypothetical protein
LSPDSLTYCQAREPREVKPGSEKPGLQVGFGPGALVGGSPGGTCRADSERSSRLILTSESGPYDFTLAGASNVADLPERCPVGLKT